MLRPALFLTALLTWTAVTAAQPFGGAPSKHWAYDAIAELAAKGIIEGYPDGTFKGDRPMTRYEVATVVARLIARIESVQIPAPAPAPQIGRADIEALTRLLNESRGANAAAYTRLQRRLVASVAENRVRTLEPFLRRLGFALNVEAIDTSDSLTAAIPVAQEWAQILQAGKNVALGAIYLDGDSPGISDLPLGRSYLVTATPSGPSSVVTELVNEKGASIPGTRVEVAVETLDTPVTFSKASAQSSHEYCFYDDSKKICRRI